VKNETRSGHSVPNVSLRIGRTSLRANRGSTALGSPESKLTRDIAGPARGMQTDRMLGLSRRVLEMPQKGSTTELTRANEALRGYLDGLASVPELDEFLGQVMAAITDLGPCFSRRARYGSCGSEVSRKLANSSA
jgi:hypothetical protein